jgi:hypothetical protein
MAVAEKKAAALDELLLFLGEQGEVPIADAVAKLGEPALSGAWAKGYVEFGRTKYCVSGNPENPKSDPCLIIEGGVEWGGAKTARHGRLAAVLAWKLPACERYERYQQEVCVNPQKDAWEWVESPEDVKGRETRWARRTSSRKEAEAAFRNLVRLTDAGVAALQD